MSADSLWVCVNLIGLDLYRCGLRFYDVANARWLTRDPIGYDGGQNLYGYVDGNPIMGADPSGLRPLTSGDLASLRNLYHYFGNNDVIRSEVKLSQINRAVSQIKSAIDAVPIGRPDPYALKAVLWGLGQLGNEDWGVNGTIKLPGLAQVGPGNVKCNQFVAAAYLMGAEASDWSRQPTIRNQSPASANLLATPAWYMERLPLVSGSARLGDIISFYSPGDQGHTTLYLGGGLLIYGGEFGGKVGPFLSVMSDGHTAFTVRRYH